MRQVLLATGAFAVGTSAYVVSGILPEVSAELRVSVGAAGQLVTAFALAYALGAPLLATVLGPVERRTLLVGSLVVAAAGNALAALAPTYPLLIAGRVLTALGAAAFTPAATHVATMLAPPERRGRAVAGVFTGITLSLVIGVPAGTLLGGLLGYRGVFAVVAALCLVGALAVRVALPVVEPPPPVGLRARLAVAADPAVLTVLGVLVLGLLSVLSVYSYVAPLLAASAGVGGPLLGALLVAYGVGGLIGNDLGGRLTDRIGSRRLLAWVLPAATLVLLTLPWTTRSVIGSGISLFLLGIAFAVNAPIQSRLIELAPRQAGLVLALNASAIYLGIALAGVVGGLVVEGFGVLTLPYVAGAFGLAALGLFLVTVRQESRGPEPRPERSRR